MPNVKRTLVASLVALFSIMIFGRDSAADSLSSDTIIQSTEQLQEDWRQQKEDYRDQFKTKLELIDRRISDLKKELDGGDPAKREAINEAMADLERKRHDVRQIFNEITATSGVRWANVPGDLKDKIQDMKD